MAKRRRNRGLDPTSKSGKARMRAAYLLRRAGLPKLASKFSKNPLSLGLPRNKWVNARVRVTSGGKIQAQVSENVLGALTGKSKNKRKRKVNRRKKR